MNERFFRRCALFGTLLGTAAALYYARQGLTLSHYDAKAHLVVARRVLDSLTPEYSQIGAVWLPLPHLLNLLPVQIDVLYRTGASGIAISVLSFALACYAIARIVMKATCSRAGALAALALFALDPNVLYLQSTPMTEPLLFGLTLFGVALVYDWVDEDGTRSPRIPGLTLAAACLTRYEAWFVTAGVLGLAALALWRRGMSPGRALLTTLHLAAYPIIAILTFFFHSWFTTGDWFVTGGFFVPDNVAEGSIYASVMAVVYGLRILAGRPIVFAALAGVVCVVWRGFSRREYGSVLVVLALAGFMALPAYAFYEGHPFRMRYIVAPTVGAAVFVGVLIGTVRASARPFALALLAVWMVIHARPLNAQAPMVQEAQWDRPLSEGRKAVTECLVREYDGTPILASMGSLAHYMQELSQQHINIRNFVHEGNLPYWQESIESPEGRVKWILIEERAEGGDALAARSRASSAFLTGFKRECAGGGVALYRAVDRN